jgi:hypothetical protein
MQITIIYIPTCEIIILMNLRDFIANGNSIICLDPNRGVLGGEAPIGNNAPPTVENNKKRKSGDDRRPRMPYKDADRTKILVAKERRQFDSLDRKFIESQKENADFEEQQKKYPKLHPRSELTNAHPDIFAEFDEDVLSWKKETKVDVNRKNRVDKVFESIVRGFYNDLDSKKRAQLSQGHISELLKETIDDLASVLCRRKMRSNREILIEKQKCWNSKRMTYILDMGGKGGTANFCHVLKGMEANVKPKDRTMQCSRGQIERYSRSLESISEEYLVGGKMSVDQKSWTVDYGMALETLYDLWVEAGATDTFTVKMSIDGTAFGKNQNIIVWGSKGTTNVAGMKDRWTILQESGDEELSFPEFYEKEFKHLSTDNCLLWGVAVCAETKENCDAYCRDYFQFIKEKNNDGHTHSQTGHHFSVNLVLIADMKAIWEALGFGNVDGIRICCSDSLQAPYELRDMCSHCLNNPTIPKPPGATPLCGHGMMFNEYDPKDGDLKDRVLNWRIVQPIPTKCLKQQLQERAAERNIDIHGTVDELKSNIKKWDDAHEILLIGNDHNTNNYRVCEESKIDQQLSVRFEPDILRTELGSTKSKFSLTDDVLVKRKLIYIVLMIEEHERYKLNLANKEQGDGHITTRETKTPPCTVHMDLRVGETNHQCSLQTHMYDRRPELERDFGKGEVERRHLNFEILLCDILRKSSLDKGVFKVKVEKDIVPKIEMSASRGRLMYTEVAANRFIEIFYPTNDEKLIYADRIIKLRSWMVGYGSWITKLRSLDDFTHDEADKLQIEIDIWVKLHIELYGKHTLRGYYHHYLFKAHIRELLYEFGSLTTFCNEDWECFMGVVKKYVKTRTPNGGHVGKDGIETMAKSLSRFAKRRWAYYVDAGVSQITDDLGFINEHMHK